MAARQAPLSLGFSRQEHWSGLSFPSPMHESEVAQSCPTLSNPMGCSLPGSSVHGIFQARVLEWGAISCFSCVQLFDAMGSPLRHREFQTLPSIWDHRWTRKLPPLISSCPPSTSSPPSRVSSHARLFYILTPGTNLHPDLQLPVLP